MGGLGFESLTLFGGNCEDYLLLGDEEDGVGELVINEP
jgi:hypothetical protein